MQEQLHGLGAGEFAGTFEAFVERIHPDDREGVLDRFAGFFRNRQSTRVEYRTRWQDGSLHWITGLGRTFCTETGEPIRAAGVSIDNTAQQAAEERLQFALQNANMGI